MTGRGWNILLAVRVDTAFQLFAERLITVWEGCVNNVCCIPGEELMKGRLDGFVFFFRDSDGTSFVTLDAGSGWNGNH